MSLNEFERVNECVSEVAVSAGTEELDACHVSSQQGRW